MSETIKVPIGVPEDLLEPPIKRSKGYDPVIPYSMYKTRSYEGITGFETTYPEPPSKLLAMLDGLMFKNTD